MLAFTENLNNHKLPVIMTGNLIFCAVSVMIGIHMGGSLSAIAAAAVLFLCTQALILWIFYTEKSSLPSFRESWTGMIPCYFGLAVGLITIYRCFITMSDGGPYSVMGTALGICLIYMSAAVSEMICFTKWTFENLFAVQAAVLGIIFGMVFPLNTIADEPQHMRTAYNLSNYMMGIHSPEDSVMMRKDDAEYDFPYTVYDINNLKTYMRALGEPLKDETLIPVYEEELTPHTLDYAREPRVFKTEWYQYLAPAAGITLGRLLRMNTVSMYLLGRLFNLIFYIAAIYIALKTIPAGKSILYSVSLFPISLQLASSMSRDVFRISSSVLCVALTLYLFYTEREQIRFRKTAIGTLAVSAVLLFPLRTFVYSLIALLPVFMYLYRKKWITGRMIRNALIALAVLSVAALVLKYFVFPGNIVTEPQIKLSWTDQYRYTKEVFINHPLFIFTFLKNTLAIRGDYYVKTMIGNQLGWLDLNIPEYLVSIFLCLMIANTIRRDYEKAELTTGLRITMFSFSTISVLLIILGLALLWTPVTSPVAEGVQGRYFLPIALPMLLAFRGSSITANEKCDIYCICIQFIALILTASFLITRLL